MIYLGSCGKRELILRIGFLVTNSKLLAGKVVEVNNGRNDDEKKIKEVKNTLCCCKTSCLRFIAHQARLLMGVLSNNLTHMVRQSHLVGETIKRSMEWFIKGLIKVEAKVAYHRRKRCVHVASTFPLARLTSFCSRDGDDGKMVDGGAEGEGCSVTEEKSFYINMTKVLPLSGCMGHSTQTSSGSAGRPLSPSGISKRPKWQHCGIIAVTSGRS